MRRFLRHTRYTRLPALVLLVLVVVVPGSALAQGGKSSDGDGPGKKGERPTIKPRPEGEVVPDQVIVKFKEDAGAATRSEARRGAGLEKKKDLDLIGAEVDRVRGKSVEQAVRDLESRPDVEYAEPDFKVYPTGYADEPRFGDLWGLDNTGQAVNGAPEDGTADVDVDAREASSETQGDPNLVIAVIDDGVDFSHPDLKDRAWTNPGETPDDGVDNDGNGKVDDVNGWDFDNKDETVHDDGEDYHGTHVAGTIAASANGEGVVGVAPNVKIMALKFLGPDPDDGAISDAILAIQYAKSKGAKISNNSWGGGPYSRALKDAIDASGQLFVAAAGNGGFDAFGDDNDTPPQYPASYASANVLSVAAVDNRGNLGNFSNYGAKSVDISAPGVDVLSSVPGVSGRPGAALSSVGSSGGEAFTAGFGAEEIGTKDGQSSFVQKALEAVGQSSSEPVLLVDDDRNRSNDQDYPDVGPTLSAAIESATGSAPEETINVPDGNGPNLDQLQGKTVVWATGQAFNSGSGATTLTSTDQSTLTNFLNGGGKLVLTGMDALYNIENSTFVTSTLKLDSQGELSTVAFEGAAGTALDGKSYDLDSSLAIPEYHDVLVPAGTAAETQGNLKSPHSWRFFNGTSMAAPHATGVAALAASKSPGLLSSPATLKQVLMDSGKPVPATQGKTLTGKMVDANAALAPRVTTVSPKSGARNVSRGANVVAVFSEEMDEASVEAVDPTTLKPSNFTLVRAGTTTPIKATVTYDETTKKATLNPSYRLRSGATYIATVKGGADGVKNDATKEPMASSKTWKFKIKKY